jgi:hypothetical protein
MRNTIFKMALILATSWSASPTLAAPTPSALEDFTGRLEFPGEFILFRFPASSARGRECVSGAFPLDKHIRAKQRYKGKVVRIRGRMVPYASLTEQVGATERGWKGTPIQNYCGGKYVLLAEKIGLYRARGKAKK